MAKEKSMSVSLILSAYSTKFSKGLKEAGASIDWFTQKSAGLARMALPPILAGGAALAGVAAFAATSANAIDDQINLANRLGITAGGLQELDWLATRTGTDLSAMTGGVTKLSKSLVAAENSTSKEAEALKALGLDAQELGKMKPDEAFKAVGAAIGELPNDLEQVKAVTDLFGRSGTDLLTLFRTGKSDLAAYSQEAKDFGLVISDVDSASISNLFDNFDKLFGIVKGLGVQLAVQLAPLVSKIAEYFIGWYKGGMAADLVKSSIDALGGAIGFVQDKFHQFQIGIQGMKVYLIALKEAIADSLTFSGSTPPSELLGQEYKKLAEMAQKPPPSAAWKDYWKEVRSPNTPVVAPRLQSTFDLDDKSDKSLEKFKKLSDELEKQRLELVLGKSAAEEYALKMDGLSEAQIKYLEKQREQVERMKKAAKDSEELKKLADDWKEKMETPAQKYMEALKKLKEMRDQGLVNQKDIPQLVKNLRKEILKVGGPAFASIAEKGSQEARDAELKARFGKDWGAQDLTKAQLAEAKEQTRIQKEMLKKPAISVTTKRASFPGE